jgi:hypothetical protein
MLSTLPYQQTSLTGQYLLGYHGCDISLVNRIISGEEKHLEPSKNDHDWLGRGAYFWIDSPARAFEWAKHPSGARASEITTPAVLGAVIQPGRCLNLTDIQAAEALRRAYLIYESSTILAGQPLPRNETEVNGIFLRRKLDCAVINSLHQMRLDDNEPAYDSVLGVFEEGEFVFEGSGIREKTHIQMAVLNIEECIKGYFRVPGYYSQRLNSL